MRRLTESPEQSGIDDVAGWRGCIVVIASRPGAVIEVRDLDMQPAEPGTR